MTADKNARNDGAESVEEAPVAAEKPAAKKPAAKKPAAKKSAAKKPAAKKPAEKKTATKKTAAKKPAGTRSSKKSATEKSTTGKAAAESVEEAIAQVEEAARTKPPVKKKSAKGTTPGSIRITQVRSQIGYAQPQRRVLAGLGLGRVGRTVVRVDDPCVRGMITKVSHLVSVEKVEV